MSTYEEYILSLTNKARQQRLNDIEAGIITADGQVSELQTELTKTRTELGESIGFWHRKTTERLDEFNQLQAELSALQTVNDELRMKLINLRKEDERTTNTNFI